MDEDFSDIKDIFSLLGNLLSNRDLDQMLGSFLKSGVLYNNDEKIMHLIDKLVKSNTKSQHKKPKQSEKASKEISLCAVIGSHIKVNKVTSSLFSGSIVSIISIVPATSGCIAPHSAVHNRPILPPCVAVFIPNCPQRK